MAPEPPPEAAPTLASAPAQPEAPVPEATPDARVAADDCALSAEDLESDEEALAEGEGDDGEKETPDAVATGAVPTGPIYSADISDEELARRWKDELASLGSMAVGFAHSGRLVNARQFPQGEDWIVVTPAGAWATEETVNYLAEAIRDVRARFPNAPPLRVNGMSHKEGGYMRPHKSHQNGRDVDVGFYYPTVDPIRTRARERVIDVGLNWALIRSLLIKTDVQMILVDRRVRKVIYDHAVRAGEDKAWLDSIFNDGPNGVVRHARGHRDHFHIRFHNPRAQELGRRVQPFLALQPEHNVTTHRIRSGDTLGGIALKYGSTVAMIKKANRMKSNFLRAGNRLSVPLRGPCTHCPVPPPFVLPSRRLPPDAVAPAMVASAPAAKATEDGCARPAVAGATPAASVVPAVGAASVEAASTELAAPAGAVASEGTADVTVKRAGGAPVDVASTVKPAAGALVKPVVGTVDVAAPVTPAAAVNVASTSVPAPAAQGPAGGEAAAASAGKPAAPLRETGEGAAGVTHGR
ncbi:penicillin-insensitive murein endopeptidase [Corallococcus macrosporus]|uniref:Peptidoglycan-binding protein LysM n=1 Tax=Corallococcus macrosporus DSM 14697 TaxID=1189310 RepID=A0A250JS14_9BACT|nr:penicillin-insensitive murein endopeptidase [Corallococcus macrosporus]ATB46669.1 peptidoglycan-binding protein LysM [Corallococcus macrosporus DSM 14697]